VAGVVVVGVVVCVDALGVVVPEIPKGTGTEIKIIKISLSIDVTV